MDASLEKRHLVKLKTFHTDKESLNYRQKAIRLRTWYSHKMATIKRTHAKRTVYE